MTNRFVGPILILTCTVIWGAAFLAQKLGAEHYGPFSITCYRNILGALFLALIIVLRGGWRALAPIRREVIGGSLSGACLFAAMASQQLGIEHTTPGISAFLTANYVLLVPILAWTLGRGRPACRIWISVALAMAGTFLISISSEAGTFGIGRGEALTLLCALLFAVQIMVVDRFARSVDVVRFSMVQLMASAIVAIPFVFLPGETSRATWSHFVAGLPALAFVGVLSSGVAYTLQNLGQARTPPALAAILMSTESVFGALFGYLILGDAMSVRQLFGCALVLVAVVYGETGPQDKTAA